MTCVSRRHNWHAAGSLRPIARAHLNTLLELLLNYLVSLGLSHDAAPVDDLVSALADAHDVPRDVSNQVLVWFGQVEAGTWKMDVDAVVAEIGVGIVRHHKVPLLSLLPLLRLNVAS
jgi:sister chromatid cohesion protein DCC1